MEIKIKEQEVTSAFNELNTKLQALEVVKHDAGFSNTSMEFASAMEEIENSYYQVMTNYKRLLTEFQQDALKKIQEFIQVEEELGQEISSGGPR
ncbi:DUF5344 family protein [Peribacillus deserti]|uniref:TIGR04197 family type VII secretion effector n=1 Tax=Peribacillus deserti TaxID=673318 RepID=A0A2N5M624_9BACI|nr:DUF5344 family protein [Peribacillus deserti]PLT29795.1 hypothetical protein CUU66_10855 [Peribacillus deserti]